jgi:hypothetical protein
MEEGRAAKRGGWRSLRSLAGKKQRIRRVEFDEEEKVL